MVTNKELTVRIILLSITVALLISANISIYNSDGFLGVLIFNSIIGSLISFMISILNDKDKRKEYEKAYIEINIETNIKTLVAILISVIEVINKDLDSEETITKIFSSMRLIDRILSYKDYVLNDKESLKSKLNSLDLNSPNLKYELTDIVNFLNTELIKMSIS